MPASEAQIRANQANAARSTGPKTVEGKERSRRNSLKHGLTGEGVVLPDEDAAEVERTFEALREEMRPSGTMGEALVRRMATSIVRMERCVLQETASLSERVRRAEADFEAPEGLDSETIDRLRAEAGRRAMFDPSKEATLARKYEAAAERGMYRALKEFRQVEREAKASPATVAVAEARAALGSIFQAREAMAVVEKLPAPPARPAPIPAPKPVEPARIPAVGGWSEVPITIGRAR